MAATNIDVKKAIAERRLREDLYYRLNAFTVTVPPLRERREEIPILLRYYMNNLARQFGKNALPISDKLMQECMRYAWPGNLRELGNLVKRYLVLEDENQVLDELQIHQIPVLFGAGRRLFEVLPSRVELEIVRVIDTPEATHIRYRVRR